MPRKVGVMDLSNAISDVLQEYTGDVKDRVEQAIDETAKEARAALRSDSPKRTGKYAKGWGVRTVKGANFTRATIHNKHYQRVHLLEKGHASRSGGRVAAIPHVAPVEQEANKRLEERITQAIEEAGR